jgi:hypothetical protein
VTYFLDLRAESVGGNPVATSNDIVVRTDAQPNPNPAFPLAPALLQAVRGRDVLLATHGFNVNRADGMAHLSQWNRWVDLGANGFFVGVLWPGDSRWLPVLDYPFEGNEAIRSGRLLAGYLVANFGGVNSLSFASHSLGARVVLETILNLPKQAFVLNSLTVMAGAIDDTCLSDEYANAASRMAQISVLASRRDDVLELAFPAGNPLAGIITRGHPYWHGALGRYGPNPQDQPRQVVKTPIVPDSWQFGHGSYITTIPADGKPQSGPFYPPAVVVPAQDAPLPGPLPPKLNWQQAWSAGFVSTRFAVSR